MEYGVRWNLQNIFSKRKRTRCAIQWDNSLQTYIFLIARSCIVHEIADSSYPIFTLRTLFLLLHIGVTWNIVIFDILILNSEMVRPSISAKSVVLELTQLLKIVGHF